MNILDLLESLLGGKRITITIEIEPRDNPNLGCPRDEPPGPIFSEDLTNVFEQLRKLHDPEYLSSWKPSEDLEKDEFELQHLSECAEHDPSVFSTELKTALQAYRDQSDPDFVKAVMGRSPEADD